MIKELKYFLFIFVITLIFFLSLKYYFSDDNKRNYYRSYKQMDKKIIKYAQNLILLKSDTTNTVEYVERETDKNKKNYTFWKLINDNE